MTTINFSVESWDCSHRLMKEYYTKNIRDEYERNRILAKLPESPDAGIFLNNRSINMQSDYFRICIYPNKTFTICMNENASKYASSTRGKRNPDRSSASKFMSLYDRFARINIPHNSFSGKRMSGDAVESDLPNSFNDRISFWIHGLGNFVIIDEIDGVLSYGYGGQDYHSISDNYITDRTYFIVNGGHLFIHKVQGMISCKIPPEIIGIINSNYGGNIFECVKDCLTEIKYGITNEYRESYRRCVDEITAVILDNMTVTTVTDWKRQYTPFPQNTIKSARSI